MRRQRGKSVSGIYHCVVRGVNKQIIFEGKYDYDKFLKCLAEVKLITGISIYAYCLMNNHVHLLIKETDEESIGKVMKRILDRYVIYYNKKYGRIGPLFQDRFHSENVTSDRQFLATARYIFQNPVKAGIVNSPRLFRYSGYTEFFGNESALIDKEMLLGYFTEFDHFTKFMEEKNNDDYFDYENEIENFYFSDEEALDIINDVLDGVNVNDLVKFNPSVRNGYLKRIREKGLKPKQISRITGISRYIIQRA